MSYDPKNAVLLDPADRLRRDITLLSDEQRAKIYDEAIDDMPEAHKAELSRILPKPVDKKHDEIIDAADQDAKATAADFVALKLPADKQSKIGEKVAAMLKEAEDAAAKKKPGPEDEDTSARHRTTHAHHTTHAHR